MVIIVINISNMLSSLANESTGNSRNVVYIICTLHSNQCPT